MRSPSKISLLFVLLALLAGWAIGGLMFRGGGHQHGTEEVGSVSAWTCSMHPQVQQPKPGKCPICAMDLIPLSKTSGQELGPRQLTMSEAAKQLAQVQTVPVERRFVEANIRMVGKVAFDETRMKTVAAYFPARIDRLYVDYTGVEVRAGDHLAEVYSPQLLSAQTELLSALKFNSNVESAREKLRLWGLSEKRIQSIEERDKATDRMDIDSPLGGIVIQKHINQGDYVETGEPLFTIADLNQVWVTLDAYESDLPWLRFGQKVEFEAEGIPGRTFEGTIAFIAPTLDPKTRTLNVRVNAENPNQLLKPEMFVRAVASATLAGEGKVLAPDLAGKWISPMHPEIVRDEPGPCPVCGMALVKAEELGYTVPTAGAEPPMVIPARAVLKTGKRSLVYVEVPENEEPTYEGREIVLGPRAGEFYLVEEGLRMGEKVVTEGNFKIDSALQIQAKASMMNPDAAEGEDAKPLYTKAGNRIHEAPEIFHELLGGLYISYLEVQKALAKDSLEEAKVAAAGMKPKLEKVEPALLKDRARLDWMRFAAAIQGSASMLAEAKKLDAARDAFFPLSETLLEVASVYEHSVGDNAVEVHCPMAFDNAGANWLQIGREIRNPYFGASMLGCGEIQEALGEVVEVIETEDAFRKELGVLLKTYWKLQTALAGDALDKSQAAVGEFRKELSKLDGPEAWQAPGKELAETLDKLEQAKSLEEIRIPFEPLSMQMEAIVKSFRPLDVGAVYEVHCPMAFDFKGASWLQDNPNVLNPYFGDEMLECGSVKKQILGPETTSNP